MLIGYVFLIISQLFNFLDRSNFFENMLNSAQEPSFVGAQGNKVLQCPAATGNDTDDVSSLYFFKFH